jgi:thiamine monophosphate synthase
MMQRSSINDIKENDPEREGMGGPRGRDFLLAVITAPGFFAGEADLLEGLLENGLQKLHLRKPGAVGGKSGGPGGSVGAETEKLEGLLERLSPRWHSRLVWHGSREMANRYRIPQIHGSVREPPAGKDTERIKISTSVHSWQEVKELPEDTVYTFLSPLFDSISKPGYRANTGLLQKPAGRIPCKVIGLGGIGEDAIGVMIRQGWDGAAVLGWLWEEPREAVRRFRRLKEIINECP